MTLRARTLLLLGLALAGIIATAFVLVSHGWLSSVRELEEDRALVDLDRLREALHDDAAELDRTAQDWACWDDACRFVQDRNDEFVQRNLRDDAFARIHVDAMAFMDTAGAIAFPKEPAPDAPTSFPQALRAAITSRTLELSGPEGVHGIAVVGDSLALVAARPIVRSDGAGPPRGTLVLARRIDAQVLDALSRRTRVGASVVPLASPGIDPADAGALPELLAGGGGTVRRVGDEVRSYAVLRDVSDRPAALLRASGPPDVSRAGERGLSYLLVSLVAAGAVIAAVTLLLLERQVLSRLRKVGDDVHRVATTRDLSLRVREEGADELTDTAAAINGALDALADANHRREETEAALRASEDRLHDARRLEAIGRLAGGVAHDYNNLLTIVLGYSDMIARRIPAGDPSRAQLGEIRAAGERAAKLTQQLLSFGRRQPTQPRLLDLTEFLDETEPAVVAILGDGITIRRTTSSPLDPVLVDPSQLAQVVTNLVQNARDAMPDGGTLSVDTRVVVLDESVGDLPPGRYVRLSVTDDGRGMDAATTAHLFEPFFTTKDFGQGSGLGLASVHGIVHRAGGGLTVESATGKGTTIRVHLPSAAGVEAPPDESVDTGPPVGGSETVLVVEDEPSVRVLATRALSMFGYEVLDAPGPEAAVALVSMRAAPLHCIVTDVLMPRMNGCELARRLAEIRPDAKILYTSGYPDDPDVRRAIEQGAAFLPKPFTPDQLAREVRKVLDAEVAAAVSAAPARGSPD